MVLSQDTENSLVLKLSVPLKVSTACEEDLTDTENTHTHCDEYIAGAEDLTKLNFPLLPFPIFHLPQRRRTCVGKNNAHHTHATLSFLYCNCDTPLKTHTAGPLCQSLQFSSAFSSLSMQFFSIISPLVFLISSLVFSWYPISPISPHSLHPFVIYVVLCG